MGWPIKDMTPTWRFGLRARRVRYATRAMPAPTCRSTRELASRLRTILVHLIKLQASPATEPRGGWRETLVEQRSEIERIIKDSPSLRQTAGSAIAKELGPARRQASFALTDHGEAPHIDLDRISYTEAEILGDWFPGEV